MGIFARHEGQWYRVDGENSGGPIGGSSLSWAKGIESEADLAGLDEEVVAAREEDTTLWARCGTGDWRMICDETGSPDSPGPAVIGDTTGPVTTSSFTGDGTNGDADQAYDVYTFTGSGELDLSNPGFVDVLVVAGGAGGGNNSGAGGGGGELKRIDNVYVVNDPEHVTVTIGAGGNGGSGQGNNSALGSFVTARKGTPGGANAGKGGSAYHWNTSFQGQQGWSSYGGGGAGTGGPSQGGNGGSGPGPGLADTITNTSKSYGNGGTGIGPSGGGGSKPANTGQGGNGGNGNGGPGGSGGSGVVIVRVKVDTPSFNTRTRTTAPRTAHAARIENGVVQQVIAIPHLDDDDNKITQYCNSIGLPGVWVDTSYTGSRRGKYAGVGDLFDPNLRNAEFVSPEIETAAPMLIDGKEQQVKRSRKR